MLPSSDNRITSKVKAEPVDPAMAVEPTGPSVKAEPIEPSMKVKVEPTDSPIKVELFDPDACIDTSNLSPGIHIKAEAMEPKIKIEPMDSKVKIEPMDVDIKVEPTDSKVKIEPKDVDIKVEPTDSKVKIEPVDVDIKVEPSDSKVKIEPMNVNIKVEPGEVKVKLEPKDPKVKMERMESDVKAEPLEPVIKAEAADPKIKIEPTAHDVKVEQVDSEVKKELEVKAEMEDVKAELADSTVKSEPVDTDSSEDESMDSEEAWFIQAARVERCKSLLRQYRDITLETYVHQRKAYKMRQLIEEEEAEERARQSGAGAVQAKSEIKDEVKSEEEDEKQMPGASSGASTSAAAENSPSVKKEIRVKIEPRDPDFEDEVKSQEEDEMNSQLTEKDSASPMKGNPGKPLDSQQNDEGRVGTKRTAAEEDQKIEATNPSSKSVNQAVNQPVHIKVEPMDPDFTVNRASVSRKRLRGKTTCSPGVTLSSSSATDTKVKLESKVKEEPVELQHCDGVASEGKRKIKGVATVKQEGHNVKKEVKTEVKEEEDGASPKKLRRKKKSDQQHEKGDSADSQGVKVKKEPEDGFDVRLSHWIDMCIDFQKKKRTWHPGKPCCLPNLFLSPAGPPNRDELKPCWLRLTWQQRCDFREYVESGQVDRDFEWITSGLVSHKAETNAWQKFVHPQRNYSRPGSHAPRQRLPSDKVYEWSRELPRRMYKGEGWWLGEDGIRKMIKEKYSENRQDKFEVFESRGRAKIAQPSSSSAEEARPSSSSVEEKAKGKEVKDVDPKFVSGWPGITWNELSGQWDVKWYEEATNVYKVKGFHVFKHWEEHMGYDDALTVALNAAVDWQEQARAKGIIKQLQPKRKREEMASSTSTVGGPVSACRQQFATKDIPREKIRTRSRKRVVCISGRQSGVSNVYWRKLEMAWVVGWKKKVAGKLQSGSKPFTVSMYMRPGMSAQQADDAALREAIDFRNKLVREGVIKPKVGTKPSGVKGVKWQSNARCWMVRTYDSGGKPKMRPFRPDDDTPEADEKARLAAVECRRQWELKHLHIEQAQPPPNLAQSIEKRSRRHRSGVKGVSWYTPSKCWRVYDGETQSCVKPVNQTPREVERARKLAVKRRLEYLKKRA